jgi:uncharacterized membrane protein (UPF0182 family)
MFRFPEGSTTSIEGPPQVFARINNDPTFSSFRTLVGQQGSQLSFGDFLVIPVDDSFLYVLPVYVTASDTTPAIPELKRVIVVNGSEGTVSMGTSLPDALGIATSGVTGGSNGGPNGNGGQPGNVDQQIQQLLNDALAHFQRADAALKAGDLGTYQSELAAAEALVQQAQQLAASTNGGTGSGSGSTTTSPTPTPSATGTPSATASPTATP